MVIIIFQFTINKLFNMDGDLWTGGGTTTMWEEGCDPDWEDCDALEWDERPNKTWYVISTMLIGVL